MKTPYTDQGLVQYDEMEPIEAVVAAWTQMGRNPKWHLNTQNFVRESMPLLARALDRLAEAKP